jgi:hypothetical protein
MVDAERAVNGQCMTIGNLSTLSINQAAKRHNTPDLTWRPALLATFIKRREHARVYHDRLGHSDQEIRSMLVKRSAALKAALQGLARPGLRAAFSATPKDHAGATGASMDRESVLAYWKQLLDDRTGAPGSQQLAGRAPHRLRSFPPSPGVGPWCRVPP